MMKRFKSPSGKPVRLAQLSGHVVWITGDWCELHPRFHTDAYAAGCISEDMIKNSNDHGVDSKVVSILNNVALQKNEVETAIRQLVSDNDLDSFDSNGKPKSPIISKIVGFRVTNAVRDEVWYKVQETLNDSTRTSKTS